MGRLRDLLSVTGVPRCKGKCACGRRCALDTDHSDRRHNCGKGHPRG